MRRPETLPTPSIARGHGVWTFYGAATIDLPAKQVFHAICDFANSSQWNQYFPSVTTPSGTNQIAVGDRIVLQYRPDLESALMKVPCEILEMNEDDFSLSWRGLPEGVPQWLLLAEKVQKVTPQGDNQCLFEVWETQARPMAYIIKWSMSEKLSAMFRAMANDLKVHLEGQGRSARQEDGEGGT